MAMELAKVSMKEQKEQRQNGRKSEERQPTPPWEEASTSAAIALREQPSTPVVGSTNILKIGPLAAIEDFPNTHKGMHKFPCLNISENFMEGFGDLFAYFPGSNIVAEVEQQYCTTLCKIEWFKKQMNHHSVGPLLSCTQSLKVECGFLEDGVNFSPNKFMHNQMFIRELTHEIAKTPWRRVTVLSRGSSKEALPSGPLDPFESKGLMGERSSLKYLQGVTS